MVFIVEFADGTQLQVRAGTALDARAQAKAKFKEKMVVAVHQAGLLDMGFRRPPSAEAQK
ncbi:MAG TPA: hypothetical protein VMT61_08090 [Candidatus Binataceae bacterium]|nr:hypothetical protein [Candidatus Binataceae bacterium]